MRKFGLDVLRAAAILGVFVSHEVKLDIAGVDVLGELGTGVFLFFVLSGFLIGGICFRSLRENEFYFWGFWRSRWWRTLPPYVAAIFLYQSLRLFHPQFSPLPLYYGLFLQNYLGQPGLGVTWSLCVEEHFYLCLPVVLFLAMRLVGRRALGFLLPVLFFLPLVQRLTIYWIDGYMPQQWYRMTHLSFDYLIVGVWLSYLLVFDRPAFDGLKRPSRWMLLFPVAQIVVLPRWNPHPLLFDLFFPNLLALGLGALLLQVHDLQWMPVSNLGKVMRWCLVGTALSSYSIYLTHTTLDPLIRVQLEPVLARGPVRSIIVMAVTWIGGVAFYLLIERPTIITRDRYLKSVKSLPVQAQLPQEGHAS